MSDTSNQYQRVASAIYLITSFFADQEPLKWRLRSLSTDLTSNLVKDKNTLAKEIANLFDLAKVAGFVSESNYLIISKELVKISNETAEPLAFLAIPQADNKPFVPMATLDNNQPKAPVVAKEEIKKVDLDVPAGLLPSLKEIETKTEKPERAEVDRTPSLKEYGAVSVKKNSRQSIIIALLKRKKEVMIKDVSPLINGCSEKTIQRELSDMVSAGVLKRMGEKRWTRYTLAQG